MIKKIQKYIFLALLVVASLSINAQENKTMSLCNNYLKLPYISDGQQYRALLNDDEIAEFRVTFYGNSTYRIISCSGNKEGQLIFTVYDKNRNLLFTNKEHKNSPYWDFQFKNTVDCIIEAQLSPTGPSSGFAILQIGFKK